MTRDEVLDQLTHVTQWKRGGERAPHKPLLLLLALARCSRGESREVAYREIDGPLQALLREFGPSRKSVHPEYPVWHLQSDGIWLVRDADRLEKRASNSNVSRTEFHRANPLTGLTPDIHEALQHDRALLADAARRILDANFPATIHEDILAAVGLDLDCEFVTSRRAKRNAEFRERVLRAYERRCAVCGFDLRLGTINVALEAAHIKWHQAHGPDIESNGLALCSMHHKLLDRGAYTLSDDRLLLVSQEVSGTDGLAENLLRFHGKSIREPQSADYRPAPAYLAWHRKQVFQGEARQQQ
jgi:putative restriction endonuclease